MPNRSFWEDKTVLITGHRGFIGSWLVAALSCTKVKIAGMDIETSHTYRYFDFKDKRVANIQNRQRVLWDMESVKPDVVFHLAAQPIVSDGEANDYHTFLTNTLGTANILNAVERFAPNAVVINMSTDKVYAPWAMPEGGFTEESQLGAESHYACSKIAAETIVDMYRARGLKTVTVRAGNVFGGGDFGLNRIITGTIYSIEHGYPLFMRNPEGSRPYQYVMNVVYALLTLAEARYERELMKPWYNVGPDKATNNIQIATDFANAYGATLHWRKDETVGYVETNNLHLDCSAYKREFGSLPDIYNYENGIQATARVYKEIYNERVCTDTKLYNGVWNER